MFSRIVAMQLLFKTIVCQLVKQHVFYRKKKNNDNDANAGVFMNEVTNKIIKFENKKNKMWGQSQHHAKKIC